MYSNNCNDVTHIDPLSNLCLPFPKDTHPSILREKFLFQQTPPLRRLSTTQRQRCLRLGLTDAHPPAFLCPLRSPSTPSRDLVTPSKSLLPPPRVRPPVMMPPLPPASTTMSPPTNPPLLNQTMILHPHPSTPQCVASCPSQLPSLQHPSPTLLHTRSPSHP